MGSFCVSFREGGVISYMILICYNQQLVLFCSRRKKRAVVVISDDDADSEHQLSSRSVSISALCLL